MSEDRASYKVRDDIGGWEKGCRERIQMNEANLIALINGETSERNKSALKRILDTYRFMMVKLEHNNITFDNIKKIVQ